MRYWPPEMFGIDRHAHALDHGRDVFAWGAVLQELGCMAAKTFVQYLQAPLPHRPPAHEALIHEFLTGPYDRNPKRRARRE